MKPKRKCKKRGCRAYPLRDGDYCISHDPGSEAMRKAASGRGGKATMKPVTLNDETFPLQTIPEVKNMLERVTNATLNGEIDVNRARTAGYLASLILACLKDHDLEKRMEALEKKIVEGK
jgi:hypothetical protein